MRKGEDEIQFEPIDPNEPNLQDLKEEAYVRLFERVEQDIPFKQATKRVTTF